MERRRDARGARQCRVCGTPLPRTAHGAQHLCDSRSCIRASHARAVKKYEARKRAERRALYAKRTCAECRTSIGDLHPNCRRCQPCAAKRQAERNRAGGMARRRAARGTRQCAICSDPIPYKAHGRRITCGRKACLLRLQHNAVDRYQARKRAAARAARGPRHCKDCSAPIPADANAKRIYCDGPVCRRFRKLRIAAGVRQRQRERRRRGA